MGNGSVNENKKTPNIKENILSRDVKKEKKEGQKMIEEKRHSSFTPTTKKYENIEKKPTPNQNKEVITMNSDFQRLKSAPINYPYTSSLILTDYFDNILDKDKEEIEKMNYRYNHTFKQFNEYQDIEESSSLKQVKEKLNSEFGLMESMKNDFEKMKTCILYCPNLSVEDENFINHLEFYEFLSNNSKNKASILNIINKNKKEIPEFIANLK